jgi:signal transduction histidine kinase
MISGSELWLLKLMADRGLALLDATGLLVVLEERLELRIVVSAGDANVRMRIVPLESALGELFRAAKPLHLDRPRGSDAPWLVELGLEADSVLVEPLVMADRGAGLLIALRSDNRSFGGADERALHDFAESLAQRLLAERSVEIERLRHGLEARERERTRWARELHDETVQSLGALRLRLATARDDGDPESLRKAVDDAVSGLAGEIEGLRHLITELRPAALDDLGLAEALEALARRAAAIDRLDVDTEISLVGNGNGSRLDAELESTIYRVVQEALTNVAKHAGAQRARVSVLERNGRMITSVSDDGTGFEPTAHRAGFGLDGMRERAELLGGDLEIHSHPGAGTTVRLSVPLTQRQA